jgi:hypothetical protein
MVHQRPLLVPGIPWNSELHLDPTIEHHRAKEPESEADILYTSVQSQTSPPNNHWTLQYAKEASHPLFFAQALIDGCPAGLYFTECLGSGGRGLIDDTGQ